MGFEGYHIEQKVFQDTSGNKSLENRKSGTNLYSKCRLVQENIIDEYGHEFYRTVRVCGQELNKLKQEYRQFDINNNTVTQQIEDGGITIEKALNDWLIARRIDKNKVQIERQEITLSPNDGYIGTEIAKIFGSFESFTFPLFIIKNSGLSVGGYRYPGVAFVCESEKIEYTKANEALHAFLHRKYPIFAEKRYEKVLTQEILTNIGLNRIEKAPYSYYQLGEYLSDVIGGLIDPKKGYHKYYGGGNPMVGEYKYFLSSDIASSIKGALKISLSLNSEFMKKINSIIPYLGGKYERSKNLNTEQYNELNIAISRDILRALGVI